MLRTVGWVFPLGLIVAGCATPGARPHDMSVEHHDQEAEAHDAEADVHAKRYDPDAVRERCSVPPPRPDRSGSVISDICWTGATNPTDQHLRHAAEHRSVAAEHRAASAALRDVEARACAGINDDDRDISPFERTEDIASVAPSTRPSQTPQGTPEDTVGAIVTFRAVPGMTAERLQMVVDCHLARNASLGHKAPNMPDCPLVPNGVRAKVTSAGNGFSVEITSDDKKSAEEVLARAQRLRP